MQLFTIFNSVKWAEVNGTMYKCGAVVITDIDLMPFFAKIIDILFLLPDRTCLFVCETYTTDCFNSHFHSYGVIPTKEVLIIKQNDLIDHHVLHHYQIKHCLYQ